MLEFSTSRETLNRDLRALRQEQTSRFSEIFIERTAFLLAADDALVDNAATRAQFRDGRFLDIPGDHTSAIKIHSPAHETFRLLARLVQGTGPLQIIQLPRRLEAELDLDTGEFSDGRVTFREDEIARRIVLPTKRRERPEVVEAFVTPVTRGFFADAYIFRDYPNDHWVVRVLREPTNEMIERPFLEVWVDGRRFSRVPIEAHGTGIEAYRRVIAAGQPQFGRTPEKPGRLEKWQSSGLGTHQHVGRLLEMDPWGAVRLFPWLAETYLKYVLRERTILELMAFTESGDGEKGQKQPMVLKWLGITAVVNKNLRQAYTSFQELSQYDSVGHIYGAFVLAALGRDADAIAAIQSLDAATTLLSDGGLVRDLDLLFGSSSVQRLLQASGEMVPQ
jgi:hypothetical protein